MMRNGPNPTSDTATIVAFTAATAADDIVMVAAADAVAAVAACTAHTRQGLAFRTSLSGGIAGR